jgi:two-component sensor histidine kinase
VDMVAAQQVLYNSKRATNFDSREFLDAVCSNAKQAFNKSVNIETVASNGELSNDAAVASRVWLEKRVA